MVKDSPKQEPEETPFQKFERLAAKVVRVPKSKVAGKSQKTETPDSA